MSTFNPRDLLEKHGWTEGSGLGKSEHGIKQALKVNIKADTAGIGHDAGAVYTFHWWDHVYNSAAESINVVSDEEGVRVSKLGEYELTVKKKQSKLINRSLLYGRFVKSVTLHNDGGGMVETKSSDVDSSSDSSDSDVDDKGTVSKISDDDLFKKLGGLTAHKAARHGHRLNGKLKRLQEQESTITVIDRKSLAESSDGLNRNTKKRRKEPEKVFSESCVTHHNACQMSEDKNASKRLSKKSKKNLNVIENVGSDTSDSGSQLNIQKDNDDCIEVEYKDSSKKRKKSKQDKSLEVTDLARVDISSTNQCEIDPSNVNVAEEIVCKRRKKKKSSKHEQDLLINDGRSSENLKLDEDFSSKDELQHVSDTGDNKKKKKSKRSRDVEVTNRCRKVNQVKCSDVQKNKLDEQAVPVEDSLSNKQKRKEKKKKSKQSKL